MSLIHRFCGSPVKALLLASVMVAGAATAQDYSTMGITDVVASADRMLQRGDYRGAIPALEEVIKRTEPLTDPQGQDTCQTCRFELARAYYQMGNVEQGMKYIENYLDNEPRKKERMALRMLAQGFFEKQNWEKIEEVGERLLTFSDLSKDDEYNANLLLGQARFFLEKWDECVKPLTYAANYSKDPRITEVTEIMIASAMVKAKDWRKLFGWLPRLYRTDAKYDITLNLTLMEAGKQLFEVDQDFLNALLLYRMVLPREDLLEFANNRITKLSAKLSDDLQGGIAGREQQDREKEIEDLKESVKLLTDLPPYEDEVTFRIGQIYAEVKRYWEGYVLFDKLYRQDRTSDIGEAAMLQSVLILYDVGVIDRAEERILIYLNERPDGKFARTLLSMMMRNNLVREEFDKVVGLRKYVYDIPASTDADELSMQADLHYMLAFGYFQMKDYPKAGEQFSVILANYPEGTNFSDSRYFRGMTYMMVGDYKNALEDFQEYQARHIGGEHVSAAMFREAVCLFGLSGEEKDREKSAEMLKQAEKVFTKFIDSFPEDVLVSEAYSMRGDIEAAKEATNDDPYTLDRALKDYRKAIDKATVTAQASYPAFQAAKVYKLEFKWQEIIDLMKYYLDRWEEDADVAEAVYWMGQAQLEMGQVQEAVRDYLSAIERFGNDPTKGGIDKIILELIKMSDDNMNAEDREGLAIKIKLKLTGIEADQRVLRLRLRTLQAMLQGKEAGAAFGAGLIDDKQNLAEASPVSLALMCQAAEATGNAEEIERISDYFIQNYAESDLLWYAYKAKTAKLLAEEDYWGVLAVIDEAQGLFGAEPHMGWAQLAKADTLLKMEKYEDAEKEFNMCMGVSEWRGAIFAEAMYGMGRCRLAKGELKEAHAFFQRTYLLFKSYDSGKWAARGYIAAADVLLKMNDREQAKTTLQAMLEDEYVNTTPEADTVRELLKKL